MPSTYADLVALLPQLDMVAELVTKLASESGSRIATIGTV